MATVMRHFVLVEPFRKVDVSIFPDNADGTKAADLLAAAFRNQGKKVKVITQTGTLHDLKGTLKALQDE